MRPLLLPPLSISLGFRPLPTHSKFGSQGMNPIHGPAYSEQLAVDRLKLDFVWYYVTDFKARLRANNGSYSAAYHSLIREPPTKTLAKRRPRAQFDMYGPLQNTTLRAEIASVTGTGYQVPAVPQAQAPVTVLYTLPAPPTVAVQMPPSVECECCSEDVTVAQALKCAEGHAICPDCIKKLGEMALGERTVAKLVCVHTSGCQAAYADDDLKKLLTPALYALYTELKARQNIELAGIRLEDCLFCNYAADTDGTDAELFFCASDTCGRISCRMCKSADHRPRTCQEARKERYAQGQRNVEEAMTQALVRHCPRCNQAFVKESGCNKMVCTRCRAISCYTCRTIIQNYDHFRSDRDGPNSTRKCRIYDPEGVDQVHENDVAAARERARAQLEDNDEPLYVEQAVPARVDVTSAIEGTNVGGGGGMGRRMLRAIFRGVGLGILISCMAIVFG
ncbi:hypothetical protein CYLTODRAFT_445289 [Cylindrobasidium torrendii FP15055 ss-10]|uniref:RING-type domain-containing protein n=1 Tax=Cylindrobasidium torrendii FP15055 ss-10 TaxID=1314674 RepID=A0A0D7B7L1_9AGAR|nr:hypothetical protein CYLTODRAFT_445289 [Cylindrobasidium torrendii FP15055 ss-10]